MLPTTRVRLDLAYDGTDFHGWAAQPGLRTVQGELEAALTTVLRRPAVPVTCAGRTDTGVHARGQVVHLDVDGETLAATAGRSGSPPVEALARRLNGVLPGDVRVRGARTVPAAFDARFGARWRRYCYRVADTPHAVDPLTRRHVLAWARPLDLAAMNTAGEPLLGEHEFAAFCKRREGATTVRRLLELPVGPVRRRGGRADGPRRRLLPPHGPLAGGVPARRRGGAPGPRVAGGRSSRPPSATRACPSYRRGG